MLGKGRFSSAPAPAAVHRSAQKNPQKVTRQQLAEEYVALCSDFPIISIEDPFEQVCSFPSPATNSQHYRFYLHRMTGKALWS